ncbi:hypothetical protein [Burkholderia cepacia]|uniref:hypothetical protein n=1 Tax=Burkholderia cepacia TaxID=292 RepID=UPI0007521A70|nr:hypothetical protein [Burkholderia cepacia]
MNQVVETLENTHLKLQAAQAEFITALRRARQQPMHAAPAQIVDALALNSYRIAAALEQAARAPWPVPNFPVHYDEHGAGHAAYALYGGESPGAHPHAYVVSNPGHTHGITDPGYSHCIYSHTTTAR